MAEQTQIQYDLMRYGGYITNLDFNFQAGSSLSTASVDIVSENGEYIEPSLGSRFDMPFDLGFQMVVVEYTIVRNGFSKLLRVELADRSIEFMDTKLAIVRGEHTTGTAVQDNKLSVSQAIIYPLLEMPQDAWPSYAKEIANNKNGEDGSFLAFAERVPKPLVAQKAGSNVYIIGGGRSIFTPTNQIIYPVLEEGLVRYKVFSPEEDKEFYLVYEGGVFKEDRSETAGSSVVNKEEIIKYNASDVSLEFGYTAKEFKSLLSSTGVRVLDRAKYLDNEAILFNTAGTFRECLSTIANKLGFFFYYDFSRNTGDFQSNPVLVILGNDFINKVNNNIATLSQNVEDSAINLSTTTTLKGVTANHIVLKGEISEKQGTREGGYSGLDNVGKSALFKRIPIEKFFLQENKFIARSNLDDFYSVFLSDASKEQQFFNDFVLAYYLSGKDIGQLYDGAHCKKTNPESWDPREESFDPVKDIQIGTVSPKDQDDTANSEASDVDIRNISKSNRIRYFLTRKEERKKVENDNQKDKLSDLPKNAEIIPPSESPLHNFLHTFYDLLFNLYISQAIPSQKAGQIAFSDGQMSVDADSYSGQVKLKDVRSLERFVTLIDDYTPFGAKVKEKTVQELAELAGHKPLVSSGTAVGERMYFIGNRNSNGSRVGIRDKQAQEQDEEIGKRVNRLISSNVHTHEINGKAYLICNPDFVANMVNPIVTLSERVLQGQFKDIKNKMRVRYNRVNDEDKTFEFEFDEQSIVKPNKYSINHVLDGRTKPTDIIEKSSLVYLNGPKKDIDLFYSNVTGGNITRTIVPVIKGPLKSVEIQYFRPPKPNDINPELGVSSFTISVSQDGIATTISYNTYKFFPLDQEVLISDDRVARNRNSIPRELNAVQRNWLRL